MAFELKKREPVPDGVRRVVRQRIDRALATFKNTNGAASDHAVQEQKRAKKTALDIELIEALIGERRATLQKEARALGKKLYGQRPRDFSRQLHRYWKTARKRKSAS